MAKNEGLSGPILMALAEEDFDDDGYTLMHKAVKDDNIEDLKFFLEHWSNKNPGMKCTGKEDGRTPFHLAGQLGRYDMALLFLDTLPDKNPKDNHNYTVLHEASYFGHLEIVKAITKLVKEKNPAAPGEQWYNRTAIHEACLTGQYEVVKFLTSIVKNFNPLDSKGKSAMHYAGENGHVKIIQLYHGKMEDKNPGQKCEGMFKDRSVMHYAAQFGHFDAVKCIGNELDNKNPADALGYSVMHLAAQIGHLPILQWVVDHSDDKNPRTSEYWAKRVPLQFAAQCGKLEAVQYLINKVNIDPNVKDSDGDTPYVYAANHAAPGKAEDCAAVAKYLSQFR